MRQIRCTPGNSHTGLATAGRKATALLAAVSGVTALSARPANAATPPKQGSPCKKSQIGLAASNGMVCTKIGKVYRWKLPASGATVGVARPNNGSTTIAGVPSPEARVISKTIWFSDQEIEVLTLTMEGRSVVLDTRITNRGLRDDRTRLVLNNMAVVIDSLTGSLQLSPQSTPSNAIDLQSPLAFSGTAPSGFSLAGATVRFGDSGANTVAVPVEGEPIGSQRAFRDFVSGGAAMTFKTNSRTSQTDVTVSRSLLRPQIRTGTKGRWDLELELTITVSSGTSGGANVDPSLFAFNAIGSSCCTDLTELIHTLPTGSTATGWIHFTLPTKPGPSALLTLVTGGSGSATLSLTGL